MRTFHEKDKNRSKIHKSVLRLPQKWKNELLLGV